MPEPPGAESRPAQPAVRSSRPIAHYLFVLALVALVPAFIFSAILLLRNNEAQQRVVSSLTTATTQAIANAVDRQLDGLVTTLRVLSTSQSLELGEIAQFHDRAVRALAGSGAYIILLDADMRQLMNTRVSYGTSLGVTSDPPSTRRALASGRIAISDVFFGRTAERWVFNVVMPLHTPPDAAAKVLIITQNAVSLAGAMTSRELPEAWNVALVDASGAVISASPDAGFTVGEALPLALDPAQQGRWQTAALAGTPNTAVFWNVGDTGWLVAAWAPEAVVQKPFADTFWSLLVGGILLAAVVVLIIYWVSVQIGRSVRWLAGDAKLLGAGETVPARDYPISEIAAVSASLADASRRRKAAETEVRLLMRELAHRSKNQLTVIAAMAKQSARHADTVPEFVAGFERRIFSLARSTDLLLAYGISGVELGEVLLRQIDPLCPLDSGRVSLEGPVLRLSTQAAQILGMAAHELATNAVKYGAFAVDTGTLSVRWSLGETDLTLSWRERLGTALPRRKERRGFGTTVIETMVTRALGATVRRTLHEDGIEWVFVIPVAALDIAADREEGAAPDPAEN